MRLRPPPALPTALPTLAAEVDRSGLQCDQQEPSCGQCEKRQQKCPGYRNIVDLMFRDESSQVIKKATARTRKRATSSSDKSTSPTARRDSVPVELTWSPDAATPGPSFRKPSRQVSWSSSSASATSSPPHAFLTTFQVSPKRLAEDDNQDVKQEPAASPGFEPPAPRAFQMVPSYEDRALNLFIARYVSVVSFLILDALATDLDRSLTCLCRSLPAPVTTNLTCKSLCAAVQHGTQARRSFH